MGWFWADAPPKVGITIIKDAPHPPPQAGAVPPPACPMHTVADANPTSYPPRQTTNPPPSSCPVRSPSQSEKYSPATQTDTSTTLSKLNPLNYMPTLTNAPTSTSQTYALPLEKETSSIPRGDADSNWEYPSPQQMYNAMLRKQKPGQDEIDITAVEQMVAVHNFLNEGAWDEIVTWETLFSQGLAKGWERCKGGEEGILKEKARQEFLKARREALGVKAPASHSEQNDSEPRLLRFQGRPNEPTPKSRILQALAKVFPNTFDDNKPFDRHDWYVARPQTDGSVVEKRYVIDYYGGGLQATGEPVFYLDIRPAIDGPTAAAERMIRWGSDVWWRASGGSVREAEQQAKAAATKK